MNGWIEQYGYFGASTEYMGISFKIQYSSTSYSALATINQAVSNHLNVQQKYLKSMIVYTQGCRSASWYTCGY